MFLSRSQIVKIRTIFTHTTGTASAYLYIDGVEVSITPGINIGNGEQTFEILIPSDAAIGAIVQCIARLSVVTPPYVQELFKGQVVELITELDTTPEIEYEAH